MTYPAQKSCSKCGVQKSLEKFYRNKNCFDGRMSECKLCHADRFRILRQKPEYRKMVRQSLDKYKKTKKGLEANKRYLHKLRVFSPEKTRARDKVRYAIKTQRLVRLPCEICGGIKSQAHHSNYLQPLSVRWLCPNHHNIEHGNVWRGAV